MDKSKRRVLALLVAGMLAVTVAPVGAAAQQPDQPLDQPGEIVIADGVTQPVFGYQDAIRERVWVDTEIDSDRDGVNDVIAVDIMRPAASATGLKVPVIIDNSPYYQTLGRGNESQLKADIDGDGLLDRWPLFYDNYFVPRGYAVVLVDMAGTSKSTGCPTIQGTNENLSGPAVIDWLNGRNTARNAAGALVTVDWHNGKSAMIGKSYDGALAMAGAVSGVEGLATVVPIDGPYNYYDYTRTNGIVTRGNNYVQSLARTITNDDPARQARCQPIWNEINAADGDEHGDYTAFWRERDYLPDADKITASVFLVHGFQDDNVRADHATKYWEKLKEYDIPRKAWFVRVGHEEGFDVDRAEWVATLHRWFDYWLHGVANGIMDEPPVDVQYGPTEWAAYDDWPAPGTSTVALWLQPEGEGIAGGLALRSLETTTTQTFQDRSNMTEAVAVRNPTTEVNPNRLVFITPPLETDLHISGTPLLRLRAAVDGVDTNFGVVLMEYSPAPKIQVTRTSDGVANVAGNPRDCWGESSATDSACYIMTQTNTTTATQWRVSKGIVDGLNIYDRTTPTPLRPNRYNGFVFDLQPHDYKFSAGSRLAAVVVGSYPGYSSQADTNAAPITIDLSRSALILPVVGGLRAAADAGIPRTGD